ncbi:class I SAM-dependent methyltransferase [Nesterenkonia sp. MY13]|uniref:Class I SAM-dependent methyltransferase n=1 Tax=Nesterenkonia sedimenti TaxID=1463632 RepID=A0A7X8TIV6_9MICC|nr:class I SAM-dependent methyltransferase [Nesterenkonia sedimenti]NLS09409.1 class I SAM-dependent methyltransferase [Nesterenkonia sedimenti]
MAGRGKRWNHNLHYHRLVLNGVPPQALSALDVGCGNGLLAEELRQSIPEVIGIDSDEGVLDKARELTDQVNWVKADVMTYPFGREFDVVASVATVHHIPNLEAALSRLAALTRPGGVLIIVGMAQGNGIKDALFSLAGAMQHRRLARKYGVWDHSAPTVWPPPHDYRTVRRTAEAVLPHVKWKKLLLWRYALIWRRPHH